MWEQIIQLAANSGIWALLFVTLFFIELKESKTREEKYQNTIDSLADRLGVVCDIKEDVKNIMGKLD
ncbi:MAG: BhlA/UviB family holin-like peptide [Clostridia bacterium]|nr:BhlA/UviB family holin-like peptide [Clostridia bacterium]